MFKRKNLWRGFAYLMAAFIFFGYTAGIALETNRNMVDGFLGTKSYIVETDTSSGELYSTFTADYADTTALVAAHEAMGEQLMEEGAVLLKNNGALPLKDSARSVTLLGLRADAKTIYGATIGVNVPAAQNVSLTTALTERGFSVNPTANAAYKAVNGGDAYKKANKIAASFSGVLLGAEPQYPVAEPTIADLTAADSGFTGSLSQYNDAAIVVLGRPGTEAGDYYPGSTGVDTSIGARNALALSDAERELIAFAEQNFDTVIVLINSSNTMEIGELEADEGVDAMLWIGWPGNYGMRGVADILTGAANPSGSLPDLFASDTTSTPAMANFGVMAWSNAGEYLDTAVDRGDFYLIEAEGIYTGYRYYETRYVDVVMGQGNADSSVGAFDSTGAWNYDEEVIYPFGYGLSYTSFTRALQSAKADVEAQTVTAEIVVTNTGDAAGKTSVQLYAQAPYISGGVEKSAIVLLDFGKTKLLQPGESETVTITADLQNLTSYDGGEGTFILDGGDYYFTTGNGSHEAVNNVLAAQGYETSGDASNVQRWSYSPNSGVDTETFGVTRSGVQVANHLDSADYNTWNPGTVTYLSRADHFANYDEATAAPTNFEMSAEAKAGFYNHTNYDPTQFNNADDVMPTTGASNGMTMLDVRGKDYDDPAWDKLLDQLTIDDMVNLIGTGGYQSVAVDSVGKTQQVDCDGPASINNNFTGKASIGFPAGVVIAATWNVELAKEFGRSIGQMADEMDVSGWYAPAMNIHRSAFAGRNFEYYSEDGFISGKMAANAILGAAESGVYAFMKHFAMNDQETHRTDMLCTWSNEQAMREIYLKPFELCVKEGHCGAVMSAFNYIGNKYAAATTELQNTVLRDEWGFRGMVLTDYFGGYGYQDADILIRNGNDFCLTPQATDFSKVTDLTSATSVLAMRQACKNILYTTANSRAYAAGNTAGTATWEVVKNVILAVVILLLALWEFLLIKNYLKRRKEGK